MDDMASPAGRPWLRFYAEGVPRRFEVPEVPFPALLDAAARRHGRRTALVFGTRRVSFGALHRDVRHFAAALRGLGVGRGDRVALVLPNCPQFVVAFHAVLRAGAVAVPLDPLSGEESLFRQLADSGAVVAVLPDSALRGGRALREATAVRRIVTVAEVAARPARRRSAGEGERTAAGSGVASGAVEGTSAWVSALPYRSAVQGRRRAPEPPRPEHRDPAVLQYAGDRAVVLTHRNLVAAAHQLRCWYPQLRDGRETVAAVAPLWEPRGLLFGVLLATAAAMRTVLLPSAEPGPLLRCARRWKPTLLPAAPAELRRLAERPAHEREALATVRHVLCTPLDETTAEELRAGLGVPVVEGYGTYGAAGALLANPANANARPGTAGLPLPGCDVRIVAEGNGAVGLRPGEAGELLVRGPQVGAGVWRDPAASAQLLLPGGWLRTGDLAVCGPDGFVTVLGRAGRARRARSAASAPPPYPGPPGAGAGRDAAA